MARPKKNPQHTLSDDLAAIEEKITKKTAELKILKKKKNEILKKINDDKKDQIVSILNETELTVDELLAAAKQAAAKK